VRICDFSLQPDTVEPLAGCLKRVQG